MKSLAENQKGVNVVQQCSVENQKGTIAYRHWLYTVIAPFWFSTGTSLNCGNALLALKWWNTEESANTHPRLVVLEPVSFVDDQDIPADRLQRGGIDADQFIGGQQHVELDQRALPHPVCLLAPLHSIVLEGELILPSEKRN